MNNSLAQIQAWPNSFWVRAVLIQNFAGQLQGESGDSKSLSNDFDRKHLVALRNSADLVITGAQTIRTENPPAPTNQLWVLTKSGQLDPKAKIFRSQNTKVISQSNNAMLPVLQLSEISAANILNLAREYKYSRILIEGGASLIRQFVESNLLDEAIITLVNKAGSGESLHRSQFGLTLTQQIKFTDLIFQQWRKEN